MVFASIFHTGWNIIAGSFMQEKYWQTIQGVLTSPAKKIEIISPFFQYLDTYERKIIEHFEERSSEYYRILDDLNNRAELNLENF